LIDTNIESTPEKHSSCGSRSFRRRSCRGSASRCFRVYLCHPLDPILNVPDWLR
jgi:hypothetical protein